MAQVTDYDVANAAGSVVRAELNLILAAIKTCNAGTQNNLGTTSPYQLFADTTNNKLKIRSGSGNNAAAQATFFEIGDLDTANLGLLPASGGTMTGALLGHDGSNAAAPAFSFDTDTDLGFFRKAANILGFSSAGTERLIMDANGLTLQAQNDLRFGDSDSSHYVGFQAPSTIATSLVWTLPNADTTVAGYALISDGSGNLSWGQAGGGAEGGAANNSIFWENDQTVSADYSITNGKNAGSFGPITIASGVTVTVGSGETWTVV